MGRRGRLDRSREDVCGAVRARFVTRSVGWSSDVLVLHTVYELVHYLHCMHTVNNILSMLYNMI